MNNNNNNSNNNRTSSNGHHLHQRSHNRHAAAAVIQRAWIGYKNRQVFRLLKCTLAAAEHSLTREILRKLAPREADFFSREAGLVELKIRFRFGGYGGDFPPRILYKIYVDAGAGQCKVKYVNGRGTIRADTQAAEQSAKMMGNRRYYDLMLQDQLMRLQHRVADEVDVVNVKDFMRLLAVTDETQAEVGGKANTWRQLTSQAAPRHTVFRDVVDFLATRRLTDRLRSHLPLLTALPSSQEVRREQLRVLAEVEAPRLAASDRRRLARRLAEAGGVGGGGRSSETSRRSRQAMSRASRMRRAYLGDDVEDNNDDDGPRGDVVGGVGLVSDRSSAAATTEAAVQDYRWLRQDPRPAGGGEVAGSGEEYDEEEEEEEEDFDEEEADMLYEWSKELTEGQLASPRIA